MDNINFKKSNLFVRLSIEGEEDDIYIYSDLNGIEYLKNKLEKAQLSHLFSVDEILKKELERLIEDPTLDNNPLSGIDSYKWVHRKVKVFEEDIEELNVKIKSWLKEVKDLLGKDNVHVVYMNCNLFSNFNNDEYGLIKTLESIRLSKQLSVQLENSNQNKEKPKL